jgi:hypothetical protein
MRDNVTSHNGHLFVYGPTPVFNTYDIQPSGSMAHRKVYEELIMLLNYNPPLVHVAQDSQVKFCYPNMFYDRHLDSRLSLKHVKVTPSLPSDIAGLVHDELKVLKAKDQSLPPARSNTEDGSCFSTQESRKTETLWTTILDANSIVDFYDKVSYENCASIASTIALHPHAKTWLPILTGYEPEPERDQHPLMIDDYILRVRYDQRTGEAMVYDSIWSCLDEETRHDIRRISRRFGSLAAFQFLAPLPEVEDIFNNMGSVARRDGMRSLECPVSGYIAQNDVPLSSTLDSVMTLKSIPSVAKYCSMTQEPRRSARLNSPKERPSRKKQSKGRVTAKPWPTVIVKQGAVRRNSALFVQHVCHENTNKSLLAN